MSTESFDLLDPFLAQPTEGGGGELFWPTVLGMQAQCPVVHSTARGGFWLVTGFAEVEQAARDWETFTSAKGAEAIPIAEADSEFRLIPLETDPPYHRDLRRLFNPYFRLTAVEPQADRIRQIADDLIDRFADRGTCEFMAEFAMPFPAEVFFSCFLGIEAGQSAVAREAVEQMLTDPGKAEEAMVEFAPWCMEVIAERRKTGPQGNFLDAIAFGTLADGRPLEQGEQLSALVTVTGAGIETTAMGLGNMVLRLAQDEQLGKTLRDGGDLELACNEFLRFEAPVPCMGRRTTRDVDLGGQPVPEDERMVLCFGAANRDPAVWDGADVLDVARTNAGKHLSFGTGAHRCIGSHLAMLELQVALAAVLNRLPELSIDPADEVTWRTALTRGPSKLPLRFSSSVYQDGQ